MDQFKCKNCGADIDISRAENGVVRCEYCFSVFTMPRAETSEEAKGFIRMGEHDLDSGRFAEAYEAYRKASELDGNEPEAFFGMALSEAKVRYIKDTVNNRLQPICYDAGEKAFTGNINYRFALTLATDKQRVEYEKRAREIEYIREEFFKLKNSGSDYDTFICVKVTEDGTGEKTEDSKDAGYIYDLLKNNGYRPFYSERDIRNRQGADYEAAILYALYTAETMLVVCRDERYLKTPWVRNEYSRFLRLMNDEEKDCDGITIVYYGSPIEKLDGKRGKIQGIDFSRREADGQILKFVESHTPEAKKRREAERAAREGQNAALLKEIEESKRAQEEARRRQEELAEQLEKLSRANAGPIAAGGSSSDTAAPLKRAFMYIEDGNFKSADEYCERVLDAEPENATAYLGKLMSELGCKTRAQLNDLKTPFDENNNYRKIVRFGDEKLNSELRGYIDHINMQNAYDAAMAEKTSASTEAEYRAAAEKFRALAGINDAEKQANDCLELADGCVKKAKELETKMSEELKTINRYIEQKRTGGRENARSELARKEEEYNAVEAELSDGGVASSDRSDIETDVNVLSGKINELQEKINGSETRMAELRRRLSSLGLFAGKEKKEVRQQVDELAAQIRKLNDEKSVLKSAYGQKTHLIARMDQKDELRAHIARLKFYLSSSEEISDAEVITCLTSYMSAARLPANIIKQLPVDTVTQLPYQYFIKFPTARIKTGRKSVEFGSYPQGEHGEVLPIEWRVLKVDGDRALLISKYALENIKFNEENKDVIWETCTLRGWLNTRFIDTAFASDEKEFILTSSVSPDRNPGSNVDPGRETRDKVFLLSVPEALNYFPSDSDRLCRGTPFCYAQGALKADNGNCFWWLRTPGRSGSCAAYVPYDLFSLGVNESGMPVYFGSGAVRPALWIRL